MFTLIWAIWLLDTHNDHSGKRTSSIYTARTQAYRQSEYLLQLFTMTSITLERFITRAPIRAHDADASSAMKVSWYPVVGRQ